MVPLIALALAVLTAAGGGLWFYVTARAALPQLDGSVPVAGLSAPVTVIRDARGVPHIRAANLQDLFFAQGYVTAQDRLWQMDTLRRYAAGALAEVGGPGFLAHDREQRILGLRQASERALQDTERLSDLEAYARGVNAYIESHRDRLPVEFHVMGYQPRPWTPADSMLIVAQMVQQLSLYQIYGKVWHERVLAKLPPDLAADLYVNSSWRDHPPGQDGGEIKVEPETEGAPHLPAVGNAGAPIAAVLAAAAAPPEFAVGSNNWVVSGAHTVSGKPLLANDPHLGHEVPSVWYAAQLRAGDFDVAGVTLPGVPYVVLGHNRRIAWGFTNLGPAVADLFIENFNDKGEYQTPAGWQQPDHRREVIHVKGKPDVVLDVVTTRHGPIVSSLLAGESRKLALKWTLYEPRGLSTPFYEVDAAQNWDEFRRALSRFSSPGQNVVYADADGHIGYQATGMVPIRASGDGAVPVPGSDNAHEWTGYIPYDKLPSVFDPPAGILATANGRITPDGYPYLIATEWGPPYRTQRIYRWLQAGKKFTPSDMLALQMDIYSEPDHFFADRFVYAVDHAKNASARARQAADLMRSWDGRMEKDSAAPTIAANARYQLARLLLEPRLGPGNDNARNPAGWQQYRWAMGTVWLENVVQRRPQKWLPPAYSDYDQLLTAAVEAAVNAASVRDRKLGDWTWGKQNQLVLQHPILGGIPVLNHWTGRTVRQSGSSFCVKAVTRGAGPSERMTVDLADLDNSTLNIVLGQSGDPLSPHYMDQFDAWYEGRTFPLPFSEAAVQKAKAHELVLQPK
jgi:penicillin amidase